MTQEQFQQFVIDELKGIRSEITSTRAEQTSMKEDIAYIKGKLDSKIENRTSFIAWSGLLIALGTLLWKLLG